MTTNTESPVATPRRIPSVPCTPEITALLARLLIEDLKRKKVQAKQGC
jgi:hypothetical protein